MYTARYIKGVKIGTVAAVDAEPLDGSGHPSD